MKNIGEDSIAQRIHLSQQHDKPVSIECDKSQVDSIVAVLRELANKENLEFDFSWMDENTVWCGLFRCNDRVWTIHITSQE